MTLDDPTTVPNRRSGAIFLSLERAKFEFDITVPACRLLNLKLHSTVSGPGVRGHAMTSTLPSSSKLSRQTLKNTKLRQEKQNERRVHTSFYLLSAFVAESRS